ncbi:hypothetical protein RhiirA5_428475 [Rhizophagus irregularis]|uniref:Uncharacterized protein n=1 Tax=Rhizophagus irregularis TaxID=588596 RepID=A0A2I1EZT9_9GLOM|nr:hypothetical protein RhiirA5_428475 [Rhizophagus irregularis]PKY27622.1 hypothetical protein RhiirB3_443406 [Rhizophagus irregularis]
MIRNRTTSLHKKPRQKPLLNTSQFTVNTLQSQNITCSDHLNEEDNLNNNNDHLNNDDNSNLNEEDYSNDDGNDDSDDHLDDGNDDYYDNNSNINETIVNEALKSDKLLQNICEFGPYFKSITAALFFC